MLIQSVTYPTRVILQASVRKLLKTCGARAVSVQAHFETHFQIVSGMLKIVFRAQNILSSLKLVWNGMVLSRNC